MAFSRHSNKSEIFIRSLGETQSLFRDWGAREAWSAGQTAYPSELAYIIVEHIRGKFQTGNEL